MTTIGYGTQGRLGADSAKSLRQLAHAAETASGIATDGRHLFLRWQAVLERVVPWTQAETALLALGKCATQWYHQRSRATAQADAGGTDAAAAREAVA